MFSLILLIRFRRDVKNNGSKNSSGDKTNMKISITWLKEYIELNEPVEQIAHLLTMSGLEVEGVEYFEQVKGSLQGLVIGEVLTAAKHPNADRLTLTTVDIGEGEPVPIVCGAPNVAAGQKVVVASVGTTLFPADGEPFQITKAKIRGEVSQGMICAEDEIGLGASHDGIIVLDTDLPNGTPAAQYFNIQSDQVLEIGLTPNRADAASHVGVARDVRALLNKDIKFPDVNGFKVDNTDLPVKVTVENTEACPRYSGITLSGVQVASSPKWLQQRLLAIGLEPINNIVDATNYVLHELGQPLHAFDADAITGNHVIVKTLPEGSIFTTLDKVERKLLGTDLMICNEKEGMCIAGVFGGMKSGIKENTRNIFLESAYFSPDYVRRTSQHHTLKTDAAFRFERGTDPNITVYALKRAAMLIKELAGGTISSEIVDIYPNPVPHFEVKVTYKHVDRLIGKVLDREQVRSILKALDIEVRDITPEGFTAIVPPYRVDVQREADVIEEILRIYGYDNVEIAEHLNAGFLAQFPKIDPNKIRLQLAEMLAASGFCEIITNSLTKPAYNDALKSGQTSVVVLNKLSEDLGVMRQSLLFSGLEVLAHNINRKQKNLKLFEFGATYALENSKYLETKELAVFITGNYSAESWMLPAQPSSFHYLSSTINKIFNRFGIDKYESAAAQHPVFSYGLSYSIRQKQIAILGKVIEEITALAGVKQEVFYAVINWNALLGELSAHQQKERHIFQEISKFPEVYRDLSLILDKDVSFNQIEKIAREQGGPTLKSINVFDVYEGENIGAGKKAYAMTFTLQDQNKTLDDKTIDNMMNRFMQAYEKKLGAIIRK